MVSKANEHPEESLHAVQLKPSIDLEVLEQKAKELVDEAPRASGAQWAADMILQLVAAREPKGVKEIDAAVSEFGAAMTVKFYERDEKWGERSVVRVGPRLLNEPGVRYDLLTHLIEEVKELVAAEGSDRSAETVDIANMAFLLWWSYETESLHKESVSRT